MEYDLEEVELGIKQVIELALHSLLCGAGEVHLQSDPAKVAIHGYWYFIEGIATLPKPSYPAGLEFKIELHPDIGQLIGRKLNT